LTDHRIDLTQGATLDFYTSAVYWGIQQKFTAQQLSGFFTVNHMLFENVKGKLVYQVIMKEIIKLSSIQDIMISTI